MITALRTLVYADDSEAGRGASFEGEVVDQGWGRTIQLVVPGAKTMTLYQPSYDPPALGRTELDAMW